jgi:hypothetical protein
VPLDFGLSRAHSVLNYLADKHGLDKDRFNISAVSTIDKAYLASSGSSKTNNRMLEIVLLEWSIYN